MENRDAYIYVLFEIEIERLPRKRRPRLIFD